MTLVRQALRQLRRRFASTAVSMGLLALGLGLSVAVFNVLDRAILEGLPVAGGDRLVAFSTAEEAGWPLPVDDYRAIAEGQHSLEWVLPSRTFNTMVTRGDRTRGVIGSYVPVDLFRRLGVVPVLGRGFTDADEDPAQPAVALISHRLWQEAYGGDDSVVGELITLNRERTVVVGVLPPDFRFPLRSDVWGVFGRPGPGPWWDAAPVLGVGVLRDGVPLPAARRDLARIAGLLDREAPRPTPRRASIEPYARAQIGGRFQGALRAMMVAALVLLGLTGANLANLRLGEALRRRSELETRLVLGSGPGELAGLLLLENLLLAVGAAVLGLGGAWVLVESLGRTLLAGGGLERVFWLDPGLDGRAVGVALAGALVTGGLAALPAIVVALAGTRSGRIAREGGLRVHGGRWSRVLVGVQAGTCFALLVGAGLWTARARELVRVDTGYRVDRLSAVVVSTYQAGVEDPGERAELFEGLRARLGEERGVSSVAYASAVPWGYASTAAVASGASPPDAATAPRAAVYEVSPGFFETLDLDLPAGRPFTEAESPRDGVAIVSRTLAERLLGGDALGRTITLADGSDGEVSRPLRVVGVAADLGGGMTEGPDGPLAVYVPVSARAASISLLVRRRPGTPYAAPLVEDTLARNAPLVGLLEETRADDALAAAAWVERRLGQILSLFSLAAWLVTLAGVYAVIAVMVRGRSRELGIRAAVGARPADLRRLVLGESARQLAVGLAAGVAVLALGTLLLDRILVEEAHRLARPVLLAAARWPVTRKMLSSESPCNFRASWAFFHRPAEPPGHDHRQYSQVPIRARPEVRARTREDQACHPADQTLGSFPDDQCSCQATFK
ncbi:MAG: ABC transporter permease [Thermoanaerobaculia bacterium]